jgi:hypothetical protein
MLVNQQIHVALTAKAMTQSQQFGPMLTSQHVDTV